MEPEKNLLNTPEKPKAKKKKFKLPKWQTTKVLVYIMITVWVLVTMALLAVAAFTNPLDSNINMMQWIFNGVTLVMVQGVIGYLVKSTIENKSKYGGANEALVNDLNTLGSEVTNISEGA